MDIDYFVLTQKSSFRGRRGGGLEAAVAPTGDGADEIFAGALGGGAHEEESNADGLEVNTTKLSERQARVEAEDPNNMLAPVMPVMLIRPERPTKFGLASAANPVAEAKKAGASWGIGGVGADTTPATGAGVTVAVLDTGIDASHPAFAGVNLVRRNFTSPDADDTEDRQGHGTHCAATVFGRDVDKVRVGVARGVTKALIGKVLDDEGRGSTAGVLSALHWAAGEKANIVSLSLGFDFPGMQARLVDSGRPRKLATSMALKAYRENLLMFDKLLQFLMLESPGNPGLVVVAAAGNESLRHLDANFVIDTSLPAASSPDIISVGASSRVAGLLEIAPFSNVNPILCAPGVDIVSAKRGGGLVAMSGTSMACPHVTGLAALWWERVLKDEGRASGRIVRARVTASAKRSGFAPAVTPADRGSGQASAPL